MSDIYSIYLRYHVTLLVKPYIGLLEFKEAINKRVYKRVNKTGTNVMEKQQNCGGKGD
jgi:hypothetical protein